MTAVNKVHVGVYAIIKDQSDKIVLIEKARGPYKGKLDLPGGKVEYGETIEEALAREIDEEIGAKILQFKFLDNFYHCCSYLEEGVEVNLQHYGFIYTVEVSDNKIVSIDAEDTSGAAWHSISQLKDEQLSPYALKFIKKFKNE